MAEVVRTNRYWTAVDPSAPNNAHAFALDLVGHNKRVLELGPAAGAVTRALVDRGCNVVGIEVDAEAAEGLAEVADCLVGDLNDPTLLAKAAEQHLYDVVLAGDVLEHLTDPTSVLRASREVLVPGGYVVLSLPNIAHADIALALLEGRFPYSDTGLLDRTHLRFFTEAGIVEMLDQCGLVMVDMRRVVTPVFGTEVELDPATIAPEVLAAALSHPEAETYQFVVRAVRHDGDLEVSSLAERCVRADEVNRRQAVELMAIRSELDSVEALAAARELEVRRAEETRRVEVEALEQEASALRREIESQERHITAFENSKTMRILRPLRSFYASVRSAAR